MITIQDPTLDALARLGIADQIGVGIGQCRHRQNRQHRRPRYPGNSLHPFNSSR